MRLLLELSMECESLSRSEAVAAAEAIGTKAKVLDAEPGVLVLQTDADPVALCQRLGLCHFVSEWLFSGPHSELDQYAKQLEIEGPIRIRSTKVGDRRIDLAAVTRRVGEIIGQSRGVDLRSPRTDIRIVFSKRVHMGRLLGSVDRSSFEKRKNRYMPYFYPASLHPKFARALVNLSRVREDSTLLDPFCGTGAILAEAAFVGLDTIGSDISKRMIEGARSNLQHLGLDADLHSCDVGEIGRVVGPVSGIATDPPYGKSTSTGGESIRDLYSRAFEAFAGVLAKDAMVAMVVPNISLTSGIRNFRLMESHALRVHRSLTRHFCVLKKN